MTNDELKDIGTKDMVLYKRDDKMMIRVKRPIETSDIDDEFMREYDGVHKLMEYMSCIDKTTCFLVNCTSLPSSLDGIRNCKGQTGLIRQSSLIELCQQN